MGYISCLSLTEKIRHRVKHDRLENVLVTAKPFFTAYQCVRGYMLSKCRPYSEISSSFASLQVSYIGNKNASSRL